MLWIAFSDAALSLLPSTSVQTVATLKGWIFVVLTSGIYYGLLTRFWRRVRSADEELLLLQTALESAANAALITDRDGRIEWVNPAFTALTGYRSEEAVGQTPQLLKSGRHPAVFYRGLWETIRAGKVWRGEMENRRKDGTFYFEEQTITPVLNSEGTISHYVAIKQDTTHRRQIERMLQHFETHDGLTGLVNRYSLLSHLPSAIDRVRRGEPCSLLVLDVDRFRDVNSTGGTALGDQVLAELGVRLKRWVKCGDLVARLGNDEFALLLFGTDEAEGRIAANRVIGLVHDLGRSLPQMSLPLSCSVAVLSLDPSVDSMAMMSHAGEALLRAKAKGPGRVWVGSAQNLKETRTGERVWAQRVIDALGSESVVLCLQPVCKTDTGAPLAFEMLCRLPAPDGTLHSPAQFLGAAEQYGLMPRVDEWVVNQALLWLRDWPDLNLFVNLSGQSLSDGNLLNRLELQIRLAGPAVAERLTLEVTESALIQDVADTSAWLTQLRSLGCRFALDDFGAGFSSFGYLRTLPFDVIKLDGTLVQNIDMDKTDLAMLEAITRLAHSTGRSVVAEWVERPEILSILRALEVDMVQGYLLGQPELAPACLRAGEAS